ncbi:hypothetical protein CEK25_000235 [Fusarium fujikuroi]|nr:hypothetical protein CEK25_000235 [Fusarium fujikuroi]
MASNKPTLKVVAPVPPDISATATQEVDPPVVKPDRNHTEYEIQTQQILYLMEKDHQTVATIKAIYKTYLKNYKDLKRRTSII